MPRKRDPVLAVQEYFETAPEADGRLMLAVITGILRRRFDPAKPKARKPKTKGPDGPGPQYTAIS